MKVIKTSEVFTKRFFIKNRVLKNFAKFTGNYLFQSLFFNKVFFIFFIKKDTLTQVFSCEFCKIFKNTFFMRYIRWLLLKVTKTVQYIP